MKTVDSVVALFVVFGFFLAGSMVDDWLYEDLTKERKAMITRKVNVDCGPFDGLSLPRPCGVFSLALSLYLGGIETAVRESCILGGNF